MEEIGAALGEGENGDGEHHAEQRDILHRQAEIDFLIDEQANGENGGNRERKGGEDGTEEEVDGPLELVLAGGFDRTQAFWSEDEEGDDHAGECSG